MIFRAVMVLFTAFVFSQTPYVLENEMEIFSFSTGDGKRMSICVGNTNEKQPYMVYRFGDKDAVEFEFPDNRNGSFDKFTYSWYLRGGGPGNAGLDLNYLQFECENTAVKVYQEYDAARDAFSIGIKIKPPDSQEEIDIQGDQKTMKGSLTVFRFEYPVRKKEMRDTPFSDG